MRNGTNPLTLLDELRELGDCTIAVRTDTVPPLPALVPTDCHLGWDVTLIGDVSREAIEDVFIFVMDDMTLEIEPLALAADTPPAIDDEAPVAVIAPPAAEDDGQTVGKLPVKPAAESVRVPAERLDVLMDRVGELVIAQSRLSQLAHQDGGVALRSVSEEIERLSGELRDTMMGLRMVPVGTLFGRFRRLVHDLARDTGKAIDLVTDGEATEIDKTVVERLFDPLVHIVRNSCDHGLEAADVRLAAGKPEAGTVRMSAHQAGGEVVITIRDDGRGIDRSRVRARRRRAASSNPVRC
jgi:two-component system chemotaxis sensor kinase CheA